MGDESITPDIKSLPMKLRNRNHSYQEAITTSSAPKMSGILPGVDEEPPQEGTSLISKEEFLKKTTNQKLEKMADAINKVHDQIQQMNDTFDSKIKPTQDAMFNEDDGALSRISSLIDNAKSTDKSLQEIMEENLQLRDELDILKGVVHRITRQLDVANSKINTLLTKSMEDNLIFTGILDDLPKKDPRQQLHAFLYHKMHLTDIYDSDIISVYRLGKPAKDKNRAIVAQCTPNLRRYIQKNQAALKDQLNSQGGKFFINQQLPEAVSEQRREIREIIKECKDKEDELPRSAKSTFTVKADKVFINGQLQRKKITPPTVQNLFPDEKEQERIDQVKFKLFHTEPEHGSSFKAAVFSPTAMQDVRRAYVKLSQDYPTADHIAVACSVKGETAYQDNGEHGSGFRILRCIKQASLDNVAIFIMRHYGGLNLGPRRFTIINELSRVATEYIKNLPNHSSPPRSSRSSSPSTTPTRRSDQDQTEPDHQESTVGQEPSQEE